MLLISPAMETVPHVDALNAFADTPPKVLFYLVKYCLLELTRFLALHTSEIGFGVRIPHIATYCHYHLRQCT